MSIIDQLTDTFDPTKYKDTYKAELIKMIKKKAAEKPGAKAPEPRRRKKTPEAKDDLLEQLKASLAAIKN
jgi:DNA end-binding protein Ku